MNKIDLTKQVIQFHEGEIMQKINSEVKEELCDGVTKKLQSELNNLLPMSKHRNKFKKHKIFSFKSKVTKNQKILGCFKSVELLAASGKSLVCWFSQPINFGGAGFILDIRKIIGSNNEVDLYLLPNEKKTDKIEKSLKSYAGKNIDITITNNGSKILEANIYVDEKAQAAEGNGKIFTEQKNKDITGKLSIDILSVR